MSATPQAGANWVSGGEIKALHHIIKPVDADPEEVAGLGHNRPPTNPIPKHADEIALEAEAERIAPMLKDAESRALVVGRALLGLQEMFCAVAQRRRAETLATIRRLRADGLTCLEIAEKLGLSVNYVNHRNRAAESAGLGRRALAEFTDWAVGRFGLSSNSVNRYLRRARHPEQDKAMRAKWLKKAKENRHMSRLMAASESGSVKPQVFKAAFLALGERGSPERVAVTWWNISVEVGSDDPQEIARWFAAHRPR